MTDRVLVTGVSGFLGGWVALTLLNTGYAVRGSVRTIGKAEQVRNTLEKAGADVSRLEFVALDLMSDAGWTEAMAGVRYLQHVASPFHLQTPKDKMDLIGPAVGGTQRALNAALAGGVERMVVTSSIAAIVYGHDKARTRPFDGSDWTDLDGPFVPPYQESKTLAERRAWAIMQAAGRQADLSVINPGAIMGPLLDEDPGTSAGIILMMLTGGMPLLPRLGCTIVDVRDVAEGHMRAMTASQAQGQRIALSERTLPMKGIAEILATHYPQRRISRRQLPDWLVRLLGLVSRDVKSVASELGYSRTLETADAVSLLGRDLIPAEEAILATAESLFQRGLVK